MMKVTVTTNAAGHVVLELDGNLLELTPDEAFRLAQQLAAAAGPDPAIRAASPWTRPA